MTSDFYALRPLRLERGLGRDGRDYLVYLTDDKRWLDEFCRRNDGSNPWNNKGWFIPYPDGWSQGDYHRFARPTVRIMSKHDWVKRGDLFWCYRISLDKWEIDRTGDWIIPFPLHPIPVDEVRVVHEW